MHAEQPVEVAVIGAGQAGLAMGFYLAQQRRRFVILDAAPSVGEVWRNRYDSLRLFTPARYNNLPGLPIPLPPDTYPTKDDVANYLAAYAQAFDLPVCLQGRVRRVRPAGSSYEVQTDTTTYLADQVVVATGPFSRPYVPSFASRLGPDIMQVHSSHYRNPAQLPTGEVLVVGAGNSGAQIAEELVTTHKVFVAQGKRQPYLPQRFLGKDLFWWLNRLRIMDITVDSRLGQRLQHTDPLIGTNLRHLARHHGLQLVGRVVQAERDSVTLSDGRRLDCAATIWATGYRPDFGWIEVPVCNDRGVPIHRRGVTSAPGLYFLGLPWLYRRSSALLGGVGHDVAFLASQIAIQAAQATAAGSSTRTMRAASLAGSAADE